MCIYVCYLHKVEQLKPNEKIEKSEWNAIFANPQP